MAMAVLQVIKGLSPGQLFPVEGEAAILGRHPDCDIVLDVGAVSRQHARIVRVGTDYFVEDLNSRNGTFVNDQRIDGRHKLAENDQVRICDLVFLFHQGPPQSAVTVGRSDDKTEPAVVFDDEKTISGSQVMSKLDVSSVASGLRLTVNAEAKLKALLEIGRNLGTALELNQVLSKLLDNMFAIFLQADRGFIMLKDRATGRLIPKAVKHRREDADDTIRISRTIVSEVMESKEAVLSADAATDSRFSMSQSIVDFQIHSIMCAPLVASEGQVLGIMQIDTVDPRRHFNAEDLEVLASVACQAAVAVENAQLHEIALQERILESELDQAKRVQQAFLPAEKPSMTGYDFFHFYEAATHLGGDYFDYIPLPGGHLAVVLGDVSGKGAPAALLMAKLSAEARYCLATEPTPVAAVYRLNRVFCESAWEGRFITFVVVVIDPARHELTVVNAGHMAPLLRTVSGRVEEAGPEQSGLPLGVDSDIGYSGFSLPLAPGESLTLYTDGITEAMNVANELYGIARLRDAMSTAGGSVTTLGQQIIGDVRRFAGSRAQSDDMCMTCFGRLSQPAAGAPLSETSPEMAS